LEIISVDFNAIGQVLVVYSAFVIYLRKNGNKNEAVPQVRHKRVCFN